MKSSFNLVAATAVIFLPIAPATAACNMSSFTGPRICGTASVTGYSLDFSQTAAPLLNQENAVGVAVGSVGAGLGMGGDVQATGSFGAAHIRGSSFTDIATYENSARARGEVSFVDGFTVQPVTSDIRFTLAINGTFLGVGDGNVHFNLYSYARNQLIVYDERLFVSGLSPTQTKILNLTLSTGDYLFDWSMDASATAAYGRFSYYPKSEVDLSHTGTLSIDGEGLTFLSGHDYSSTLPPSPIPEPSTYAMFLVGLIGCGWAARRRHSADLGIDEFIAQGSPLQLR
jgi:hypothetical protein